MVETKNALVSNPPTLQALFARFPSLLKDIDTDGAEREWRCIPLIEPKEIDCLTHDEVIQRI